MGKGDSKTAKGKRATSSYGNVRSHTAPKATGALDTDLVAVFFTTGAAKKVVAKKTTAK
jgi:30S ribosomal protein S31